MLNFKTHLLTIILITSLPLEVTESVPQVLQPKRNGLQICVRTAQAREGLNRPSPGNTTNPPKQYNAIQLTG
jgi:hypothetical protein